LVICAIFEGTVLCSQENAAECFLVYLTLVVYQLGPRSITLTNSRFQAFRKKRGDFLVVAKVRTFEIRYKTVVVPSGCGCER
jgi:hypothetical protein